MKKSDKGQFDHEIINKLIEKLSNYMVNSDLTEEVLEDEKAAYILSSLIVLVCSGITERCHSIEDGKEGLGFTIRAIEETTMTMIKSKFKKKE